MSDVRTQCDIDSIPYACGVCNKPISDEEHDFSDICSACLEKLN
jgi:predicted nucleic acid-binding Zn ribbon protein